MTPLARLPDWRPRLRRYLGQAAGRPMQPGRWDCAMFAAGAVEAVCGTDLTAGWRGRYTTLAGGRRILRKAGHDDHVALVAAMLPEAHLSAAMPGDIVILPAEEGPACGVVQGQAAYVLTETGRLGLVPLAPGMRLFLVGGR